MSSSIINTIIDEAFAAAVDAETKFKAQYGEPWFCGFAWVNIRPGNSPLANQLKKLGLARKSYEGGVDVWNPGGSFTQSMDVKEAGAEAFAEVLKKYGFKAYARSRGD